MNYGQQRRCQILKGFGINEDVLEKGSGVKGHRKLKPEKEVSWKPVVDKKEEERKQIVQREKEERISTYLEDVHKRTSKKEKKETEIKTAPNIPNLSKYSKLINKDTGGEVKLERVAWSGAPGQDIMFDYIDDRGQIRRFNGDKHSFWEKFEHTK